MPGVKIKGKHQAREVVSDNTLDFEGMLSLFMWDTLKESINKLASVPLNMKQHLNNAIRAWPSKTSMPFLSSLDNICFNMHRLQGFFSKFLMGGLKIFDPRRSPTVTK